MLQFFGFHKTTKQHKKATQDNAAYLLRKHLSETLGTTSMIALVKKPSYIDLNEWLATYSVDFYSQTNLLFNAIECTCATMHAGPRYEYLLSNGTSKPQKTTAKVYIESTLNWIQDQVEEEGTSKMIFKRLFRIYAHLYHAHFKQFESIELDVNLNTSFKHFVYFIEEFKLVEVKELIPLEDLIKKLKKD